MYNVFHTSLLYLPTRIRFLIGGKRVTISLGQTRLANSLGNNNMNFDSRTIRSWPLKPRQIDEAAGVKQTIFCQFFSTFELGGIKKHLMTAPAKFWPRSWRESRRVLGRRDT